MEGDGGGVGIRFLCVEFLATQIYGLFHKSHVCRRPVNIDRRDIMHGTVRCLLWVWNLVDVLLRSLQRRMWCCDDLERVMMALDCINRIRSHLFECCLKNAHSTKFRKLKIFVSEVLFTNIMNWRYLLKGNDRNGFMLWAMGFLLISMGN